MADSTIPGLVAVVTPAGTDLFGVRQSGDARDKKLTATQLLSLVPAGGDVFKVGTPVDDQLPVWTGDGTIEGSTNFNVVGTLFRSALGNGPGIVNLNGVNILPRHGDPNTGLQNVGDDRLAMVSGGVQGITLIEASSAVIQQHHTNVGITAFAGGGSASATQLNSTYNVVDTVATTGDSVKFSTLILVGVIVYVKNDGANALDLFPGAGDDLGQGVGVAVSVAAGAFRAFIGTVVNATWTELLPVPAAGGDVTKVGTPVNNQLGVWTGDGTIEGDTNLQWDGAAEVLTLSGEILAGDGLTATPSYSFASDPNSGWRITSAGSGSFHWVNNGSVNWFMSAQTFGASTTGNFPRMQNEQATGTNPNLIPRNDDPDTGIGSFTDDAISLISGGIEVLRLQEHNSIAGDITQVWGGGNYGLTAFATGGQGGGLITSSINVYSTVATTADSATLPQSPPLGQLIYVKNDGANSMDVFPFLGDDLGEGTNIALAVAAGGSATFLCSVSITTWTQIIVPGSGDVTLDTSVAQNQILVGTGGGTGFVAGSSSLLFDGLALTINATSGGLVMSSGSGPIGFAAASTPQMLNEGATGTNPTVIPNKGDSDTGIGLATLDGLSLIAGGVEVARLQEVTGDVQFILPQDNTPLLPTFAFGDGDSGFFESVDDAIGVSLAGVRRWVFTEDRFVGSAGNSPSLQNEGSTATNPTMIPALGDVSTGIGGVTTNLSLIVGGVERVHLDTTLSVGNTFTGDWKASNASGPVMIDEVASGTNPTLTPRKGDEDTGIGGAAADQLSLIAGGVEGIRVTEAAAVITNTLFGTTSMNIAGGPALQSEAATFNNPSILPNKTDDDTGIGYGGSDILSLIAGASERVRLTSGDGLFRGNWDASTSTGPSLLNEVPSATNPTIVPNQADDNTGIGAAAADQLDLIAGGLSCMAVRETAAARQIGFYTTAPISQQTGVAVSSAGIHAALVALGLITA